MGIDSKGNSDKNSYSATRDKLHTEFYPKRSVREVLRKGEIQTKPSDLPVSIQQELEDPYDYIADDGLADALNVALVLGTPLLLTGEPGTGKTQFAYSAKYWLGFSNLIRFNVKSTTQARDFFYQIDEIRRFRDAQLLNLTGQVANVGTDDAVKGVSPGIENAERTEFQFASNESIDIRNYITLGPLGEAILRANPPNSHPQLIPPEKHFEQERSIVLIDEIDKAPRDVPNDLLNELENMEFEVPDVNERVRADRSYRPVLIITSNSERNLPDAFLRRCVYYNIPFPGEDPGQLKEEGAQAHDDALLRIIKARLPSIDENTSWVGEALELFRRFRERGRGVQKRPGTAELLNWLLMLHRQMDVTVGSSLKKSSELFETTLAILMKNKADADIARRIYRTYQSE